MVLLYGIPGDGPFELVADALEAAKTPFVIVNPRQFRELDFIYSCDNGTVTGEISYGANSYPLHDFTGIYNRAIDFSVIPEAQQLEKNSADFRQYSQLFQLLNHWIETAPCRVVNRSSAMSSNGSKPYQLLLIQPFFKVPETCITNQPETVTGLLQVHPEIIYKSASSVRSVVKTIDSESTENLQPVRFCPTLFQERLLGCNYRVHVVGNKIFAVKAASETVDYRYSNREGKQTALTAVTLPPAIAKKCVALAAELQLPFAGIDLFLTDAGEWYCFEVNPSPGFSYFELHTGQPIAKTIARYLSGK